MSRGQNKKRRAGSTNRSFRIPAWIQWGALAGCAAVAAFWYFQHHAASVPAQPSPETQAVIEQIRKLHQAARYDQAIALARAQLAKEPDAPLLHYTLGVLLGSKQDHRAAIAEFQEELRRNRGQVESLKSLGVAYTRLGELDRANQYFQKCLRMQPDHLDASFQLGRNLAQLGRYQEAERYLLPAAQSGNADASAELGIAYRQSGQPERALKAFRTALAIDPTHLAATLNLGQTLIRLGKEEEGGQLLQRHAELASWHDRLDQYQQATKLAGATPMNFVLLARTYIQQRKYAQAISAYQRALELDANSLTVAIGLASLYLDMGQLDKATQWTLYALGIDAENSTAHFLLGLIRVRKGQIEEARVALQRSKQLGSWDAGAYLHLGNAYKEVSMLTEAQDAFAQSLVLDPSNARTHYQLGLLFYQRDNLSQARRSLQKSIELEPANADAFMVLGIVNFRLNDRPSAELAFRRVLMLQRVRFFAEANSEKHLQEFTHLPQAAAALDFYRQVRRQS